MKTQLNELLAKEYDSLLWRIRCAAIVDFGYQENLAKELGIDPANLSKILTGVVDCNSKLFFKMLSLCGFVIIKNV